MSLDWDTTNMEWKDFKVDEQSLATFTEITYATMAACIGEITAENATEFLARYKMYLRVVDAGTSLTLAQVHRCIGLKTNVVTETRARWLQIMRRRMVDEMRRMAYRDGQVLQTS